MKAVRRLMALALAVLLSLAMLPASARAEGTEAVTVQGLFKPKTEDMSNFVLWEFEQGWEDLTINGIPFKPDKAAGGSPLVRMVDLKLAKAAPEFAKKLGIQLEDLSIENQKLLRQKADGETESIDVSKDELKPLEPGDEFVFSDGLTTVLLNVAPAGAGIFCPICGNLPCRCEVFLGEPPAIPVPDPAPAD